MKTLALTSPSSAKSTTTTATATATAEDLSETRDTHYFPKCRKDANCNCEMCLASINATRDLMPKSSLTNKPRTPVSFNPSFLSTPTSNSRRITISPPLNSTARMSFHDKMRRNKRDLGTGFMLTRLVLCISLIFAAEFGFSRVVLGVLKADLSPEIVRDLSEKSWVLRDVNERLEFLEREIQSLVNVKATDCSSGKSIWKINQDDLLLNSRCTLYESATEVVSIWGWPLQTAGLLTAEFSSRSLTILSGRVTEWSDGKLSYSIMKANKTWVQRKWSSSVVQFDRNTWILEYRRAGVVENSRMVSAAIEFLKFRLSREIKRMKQEFWLLPAFGDWYNDFTSDSFTIPT